MVKKRYLINKYVINRILEIFIRFGSGGAGGCCGFLSDGNRGWVRVVVDVSVSGEVIFGRLIVGIIWILD